MENTATKPKHRRSLFTLAHTDIRLMPFGNHGRTLRLVIENNTTARALQVRFSNLYGDAPLLVGGASLAVCDKDGVLLADVPVPLTVEGAPIFTLLPGEEVWSDIIPFALLPGAFFALNLYYPTAERVTSGNWLGRGAYRSRPGNFSAEAKLPGPGLVSRFARTIIVTDMTVAITSVSQIDALCDAPGRVIACFGDSVTQQSNWTAPLAKLLYHRWPGEVTLCNLGISGNQLLGPSPPALGGLNGAPGIERFAHDLLGVAGLSHAILALGANDIGLPGADGLPASALVTPEAYTHAMAGMAGELHARGVRVYAATITPRTYVRPYNEEREALRLLLNDWIRNAACFDAVLDFDAVLRRHDAKPGMKDHYALVDGLHPSPYGGLRMAKSIDLSLFGGMHHE